MIREELRNSFCFNKEELLECLNMTLEHDCDYKDTLKVIKLIEEMELPDLSQMLEYNENSNEALVYNVMFEDEGLFPFIAVSLERYYNISFADDGFVGSHCIAYSIPIVIVPYGNELENLNKKGKIICFASGRSYFSMRKIADILSPTESDAKFGLAMAGTSAEEEVEA